MANQWALLIGINQYTALQPLMYAQADAVALRNFFVDELGIPIDHCLLLTDMSGAIEPYAHYPSREEIESQLHEFCQSHVQPDDLLWIFFSGYGLTSGGQDYWLPIDADPMQLPETAISATRMFDILKTARTDQILLVVDMNRSQGAVGHQNTGQQLLTLAHDFGITMLMSCQPEQYAHETMAIRHGLFTKALLEGLRYHGCVTASQLAAYLSDRVPELSQHHWRPVQNPVTVIPPAHKFMMVVPSEGIANLPVTEKAAAGFETFAQAEFLPTATTSDAAVAPSPPTVSSVGTASSAVISEPMPTSPGPQAGVRPTTGTSSQAEPSPMTSAIVPRPSEPDADADGEAMGSLWRWGTVAIAIGFLIGVFVRYQPMLLNTNEPADEPAATTATSGAPSADGEVSPGSGADTGPAEEEAGVPLFPADDGTVSATGESALERAQTAIAAGRYGEAKAWLAQVPPELQDDTYQTLLQQANDQVAKAAGTNQDTLNSARRVIQPVSASLFNDAIEQARQIPPDDPYYEQAQADIARWSRVILDLAEGRAVTGNLTGAIAAASLVPDDQAQVYQLAQQRITTWQQQVENQRLIQQAQNSLQPGQASSFQNAIKAVQQIPEDQPGYTTAQERINQWSSDILAIARARAAQGQLAAAIAAAELVPEDTAAYDQAQQEIQRWRGQL